MYTTNILYFLNRAMDKRDIAELNFRMLFLFENLFDNMFDNNRQLKNTFILYNLPWGSQDKL